MSKVSQFVWATIVGGKGAVPFSCLKVGESFRWPAEEGDYWPKTKLGPGRYRTMSLLLKRGSQERTCRCRQGTAVIPIKD